MSKQPQYTFRMPAELKKKAEEAKKQVKASWEPFVAKINKYRQSLNK